MGDTARSLTVFTEGGGVTCPRARPLGRKVELLLRQPSNKFQTIKQVIALPGHRKFYYSGKTKDRRWVVLLFYQDIEYQRPSLEPQRDFIATKTPGPGVQTSEGRTSEPLGCPDIWLDPRRPGSSGGMLVIWPRTQQRGIFGAFHGGPCFLLTAHTSYSSFGACCVHAFLVAGVIRIRIRFVMAPMAKRAHTVGL